MIAAGQVTAEVLSSTEQEKWGIFVVKLEMLIVEKCAASEEQNPSLRWRGGTGEEEEVVVVIVGRASTQN